MEQLSRSSSPGGHESRQLLAFFLVELNNGLTVRSNFEGFQTLWSGVETRSTQSHPSYGDGWPPLVTRTVGSYAGFQRESCGAMTEPLTLTTERIDDLPL